MGKAVKPEAPSVRLNRNRVPAPLRRLFRWCIYLLVLAGMWFIGNRLNSPFAREKRIQHQDTITYGAGKAQRIRIGCYNIAHGRGNALGADNWGGGRRAEKMERVDAIAAMLKELNLDILVLNEVDFSAAWSGQFNMAERIARAAGFPNHAEQRNVDVSVFGINAKFGNAVLSRFPIRTLEAAPFKPFRFWEKWLLGNHDSMVCTISLPGEEQIRIMPIHLETRSEDVRVRAAREILRIRGQDPAPMILAGDFNSTPPGWPISMQSAQGENAMQLLLADGTFTTLPSPFPSPEDFTFHEQNREKVIDFVLGAAPWKPVEHEVVDSKLSDHLPVVVVLERMAE